VIAHLTYVMCDQCGNPADAADAAAEARAIARAQGFISRPGFDLCPDCQARAAFDEQRP
jgi:RNA polymerase-binding transcription factor DksA